MNREDPPTTESTSSGTFHTPHPMLLEVHLTSVLSQTKSPCTVTSLSSAKTQDTSTHLLPDDASPKVHRQTMSRHGSSPLRPSDRLPRKTSTHTNSTSLTHHTRRNSTNRKSHALRGRLVHPYRTRRSHPPPSQSNPAQPTPPPTPGRPRRKENDSLPNEPGTVSINHAHRQPHQDHTLRRRPDCHRMEPAQPTRHAPSINSDAAHNGTRGGHRHHISAQPPNAQRHTTTSRPTKLRLASPFCLSCIHAPYSSLRGCVVFTSGRGINSRTNQLTY